MNPSCHRRPCVYLGESLARYAFGEAHPFGPRRHAAFVEAWRARGLDRRTQVQEPVTARREQIEWFHDPDYVRWVEQASQSGRGFLDHGDTPVVPGIFEAAATVVGTVLDAADKILQGVCPQAFVPIAGLHHARRDAAAGFCVFNDCGVAIEALRRRGLRRLAYVDIDAHHGDGVFYAFEEDPELCIVDFHEDGRSLYPGTGAATETGRGAAQGTKRNVPLPSWSGDEAFFEQWPEALAFIAEARPEFILLQCGADGLAGDPLTHLAYSEAVHRRVTSDLVRLAQAHCQGRLLALGGGGYDLDNLGRAWCAVVEALAVHCEEARRPS